MLRKIITRPPVSAASLLLLLASSTAHSETKNEPQYNAMLAGGSLHICSSMSPNRCQQTDWINDNMRQVRVADLSPSRIEKARSAVETYAKNQNLAAFFDEIDGIIHENGKQRIALQEDLTNALSQFEARHEFTVTDHDWYLVTDYLEYAQANHESVNHNAAASPYGASIMQQFTAMAEQARSNRRETYAESPANILVVTASARDSYEAVSFYLNAFAETGAEVQWLGIDAPLHQAIQSGSCDQLSNYQASISQVFDRERVYPLLWQIQQQLCQTPEYIMQLIAEADGIFINGGDQSLTRQAFYRRDGQPTVWLEDIQKRVAAGTLAVGGTSAGSAIQPAAAMISNGTSEQALLRPAQALAMPPARDCDRWQSCPEGANAQSLTFHPEGGVGVFPFGLVDTHFSERQRQARLIALGADTQTAQGVGIDETTALLIDTRTGAFKVTGQHGVFFAQRMQRQQSTQGDSVTATFSYLLAGSSGTINKSDISNVTFGATPPRRAAMRIGQAPGDHHFIDALDDWCGEADAQYRFERQSFSLHQRDDTQSLNSPLGCQVIGAGTKFWLY